MRRLLVVLASVTIALAACGGAQQEGAPAGSQLVVEMTDYKVTVSVPSVKAGSTRIGVRNLASQVHSFEVIKTDLPHDKLPIDGASAKAREDGKVGGIETIAPGRSASVTLDLQPGKYVLICNVAGHYQLGMHASFTVDAP
jgi:uncharacterized cupredoxin-like copper-binding protein